MNAPMNRRCLLVFAVVVLIALVLWLAPSARADENPYSTHGKGMYQGVQKILIRSAEAMPEEHYAFKPVESVRTFGQIVGHVADSQYYMCSSAAGEKFTSRNVEKTKTTKAELVAALKDAVAFCNTAWEKMTDASGAEKVKSMGGDTPKLGVLHVNSVHSIEHYGNLITYMRMKGIVPPTSDPEFMKQLMKE